MREEEKDRFVVALRMANEVYSQVNRQEKAMSRAVENMYFESLKDLSIEEVEGSFGEAIATMRAGHGFPGPGDLREMLQGKLATPKEKAESAAAVAAGKIANALTDAPSGPYCSVIFDDPLIHKVLSDMLGRRAWVRLCEIDHEELKWLLKDFRERYRAAMGGKLNLSIIPDKLLGSFDMGGTPTVGAEPFIAGDRSKALAWVGKRENQAQAGAPAPVALTHEPGTEGTFFDDGFGPGG